MSARNLLVNDKITALYKTNISPKALHHTKINLKNWQATSFQDLQFQPISIFLKFVHFCLLFYLLCYFIHSFNVWSRYFYA